jgi:protein-tyrosine phosphatase
MGMVDIHSHILPSVDDGAKSWEVAVEMCHMAAADGITHMVASPHANNEFQYDRKAHEATLAQLREKVNGALELSLGCDFHMSFDNIVALRKNPAEFCIGNTNYLLVEFSDFGVSRQLVSTLEEFLDFGLVPIVTHPERNPIFQAKPEVIVQMAEMGCAIQVTANSLTGFWGNGARKIGEWLLKKRAVHVLASDAHDPKRRTPILSKARDAVAGIAGVEIANRLVSGNPEAIVRGESLT